MDTIQRQIDSAKKTAFGLSVRSLVILFIIGIILFAAGATGVNTVVNCPNRVAPPSWQIWWNVVMLIIGVVIMVVSFYLALKGEQSQGLRTCLEAEKKLLSGMKTS